MPSRKIAEGVKSKNDVIVIREKRLMLSSVSSVFFMNFLLNTFRVWFVRLEAIAVLKPIQLKEASVNEARATPPTMGTREETIQMEGLSPKNSAESKTVKNGSIALIVCVNETATFPRLIFVKRFPIVCPRPSRKIAAN